MGIVLGLVAALLYGGSDFGGGLLSRRLGALPVTIVGSAGAVLLVWPALLLAPGPAPSVRAIAWGLAAGLGGVDHLDRDAVLGAATGVEVFDLGRNRACAVGHNRVQLNQRGIADELTDVPGDAHGSIVSGPRIGYQVASRM